MKKILFCLMILCAVTAVNTSAKDYTAEKVSIGTMLPKVTDWKTTDNCITVDSDDITFDTKGFAWNEKYKNSKEIIEFDMTTEYNGSWMGIMLRSSKPDVYPWLGNSCILFVIKEEQIELQIYSNENGGGGYIIETVENPIKNGTAVKAAVGAVETDNGMQIVFSVDDEIIINSHFPSIKNNEGYFTLMNMGTKTKISIPKTDAEYVIPFNISVNGEYTAGSELYVDYDTISTSDNRNCEISWYTKADGVSQNAGKGDRYNLSSKDLDKYIYAGVCGEGKESKSFSSEVFFDSAKVCMMKNMVMLKDWFLAYSNGKQHQIDIDFGVAPAIFEDKIYIPLRFTAEQMGYSVAWNDNDRSVSLNMDADNILVESGNLKIINDRSFVDKEIFEKCFNSIIYYDSNTGIIVIDNEKSFDEMKANIYERLYKYMINGI